MRMTYKKRDFARILRQDQTSAEEKVWELLRKNQFMGLKFRRQHLIEGFVVDFYCHDLKLAIELDGGIHNRKMNKAYDEFRQTELEAEGLRFIRITNEEFETDPEILFNRIKQFLPSPQPAGRQALGEGRLRSTKCLRKTG